MIAAVAIYILFHSPSPQLSSDFQKNTKLAINNLNHDNANGTKIKYNAYEIYLQEGEDDSSHSFFYPKYDIIVYDTKNNKSKTIASPFNNGVAINDGKLYYFVENFNNRGKRFFEYNLTTGESTDLSNPYGDIGVYSIVSYGNEIYFSANNSPIGSNDYNIFLYNTISKQYTKFSELDIQDLNQNFLPVNNGFLVSINNEIVLINYSKNDSVSIN